MYVTIEILATVVGPVVGVALIFAVILFVLILIERRRRLKVSSELTERMIRLETLWEPPAPEPYLVPTSLILHRNPRDLAQTSREEELNESSEYETMETPEVLQCNFRRSSVDPTKNKSGSKVDDNLMYDYIMIDELRPRTQPRKKRKSSVAVPKRSLITIELENMLAVKQNRGTH